MLPDVDVRHMCDVCDGRVGGMGPWCDLYCRERGMLCQELVLWMIDQAIERGDSDLAGRLLHYWDRHWPGVPTWARAG